MEKLSVERWDNHPVYKIFMYIVYINSRSNYVMKNPTSVLDNEK